MGAFYVLASDAICLTPCIQKCVHKSRVERRRGGLDLRRLFQKNMHKATQVVDSSEVLGEVQNFCG